MSESRRGMLKTLREQTVAIKNLHDRVSSIEAWLKSVNDAIDKEEKSEKEPEKKEEEKEGV